MDEFWNLGLVPGPFSLLFGDCGLDGVDGDGQGGSEVRPVQGSASVDSEGSPPSQATERSGVAEPSTPARVK